MADETTTPDAKTHLAEVRAKLEQAAADGLAGVAVDPEGYARFLCDGEAFANLPDCTACTGSGKDTHDSPFADTAVHIPAPPVTVSGRRRQLCAWCGHVLDDLVLARVAVEAGDPIVPVWPAGQLVRFDGTVTTVLTYVDGDPLPDDCCTLRPTEPAEEVERG